MRTNNLPQEQDKAPPVTGDGAAGGTGAARTAGAVSAAFALAADQASKAAVFANLNPGEENVLLPIFSILPGWNVGTAFGLAQGTAPLLLVTLALAISAWLAVLLLKTPSVLEASGLGAAIGGALANVADRVRFGAVRDFIDLHWDALHWPTFNAADVFVVGGLLLFVLADSLRQRKKREAR